jgi:AraC family transcriptional regulator, transcriptional activator of pobA
MQYLGRDGAYLVLNEVNASQESPFSIDYGHDHALLSLLWCLDDDTIMYVDGQSYTLKAQEVVCLTEFHRCKVERGGRMRVVQFNRPFFCILDHDSEVGCKGVLFFGAAQLPMFVIPSEEREKFEILWKMFSIEMTSTDNLQLDMLQMMLKRLLILSTRLYKTQVISSNISNTQSDLIRAFNFLVEQHFRSMHTVAEYAALLYKSPKTLSNVFAQLSDKTPLQLIQERKMLEARRLLQYSDMSIKEIAFDLGYDEPTHFTRFFKNIVGISPKDFRETAK